MAEIRSWIDEIKVFCGTIIIFHFTFVWSFVKLSALDFVCNFIENKPFLRTQAESIKMAAFRF